MDNYELEKDEVILYESHVYIKEINSKGSIYLTLTSNRIIIEEKITKGFFSAKEEKNLIDIIKLEDIKVFNNKLQVTQSSDNVSLQTTNKNYNIRFDSMFSAKKFIIKINDAVTNTSSVERGVNTVKNAIDTVDDVLGLNTRETIKGVIENGIAGTLLKGINRKKKK